MPTLAQTLSTTAPVSVLLRKARRLGLPDLPSLIALAAGRGCRHYSNGGEGKTTTPSLEDLPNDELAILLIAGENPYDPIAIRCAAQIARAQDVEPGRLARLAVMEKTIRVLSHIARAGAEHDTEGADFWRGILEHLPQQAIRKEPDLPHWTRFVSMPGRQRHGIAPVRWLVPQP